LTFDGLQVNNLVVDGLPVDNLVVYGLPNSNFLEGGRIVKKFGLMTGNLIFKTHIIQV